MSFLHLLHFCFWTVWLPKASDNTSQASAQCAIIITNDLHERNILTTANGRRKVQSAETWRWNTGSRAAVFVMQKEIPFVDYNPTNKR